MRAATNGSTLEEHLMPSKQGPLPWTLTCLVLGLTVLAGAQTARVGGVG
jgi:hypothetical protein